MRAASRDNLKVQNDLESMTNTFYLALLQSAASSRRHA